MMTHIFFHKYANTPLPKREIKISRLNLNDIYFKVHKLEDEIRPRKLEQKRLIKLAEESNLLSMTKPLGKT